MKYEVAGDPVSGLRWTRKTTKKIAAELSALGIRVSRKTVAKLLKQMNFSLRTNKKKISNGSPPTRDAQFANITQLRERFSRRGNPILSVDTKKKELVGRLHFPLEDVPFSACVLPSSITPEPLLDAQSRWSAIRCSTNFQPSMADGIEEPANVRVRHPVHRVT